MDFFNSKYFSRMSNLTMKTKVQKLRINEDESGQRIDNFINRKFKGLPRSKIYRIIRRGEVRVNSGRIAPSYKIKTNDEIRIPPLIIKNDPESLIKNNSINIEKSIIFEDSDFIVIDKPAGLAVHGGSGIKFGVIELIRAVKARENDISLVHRIDKETSGCLLLSKKRSALRDLHEKFRNGEVKKNYFAVVLGTWEYQKKSINMPLLTNHRKNGERHVTPNKKGKKAVTLVKMTNQYKKFALVQCQPITGRTHQLRVHLNEIGYPIVGDTKYSNMEVLSELKLKKRLFLHAQSISFADRKGNDRTFSSMLPQEFSDF